MKSLKRDASIQRKVWGQVHCAAHSCLWDWELRSRPPAGGLLALELPCLPARCVRPARNPELTQFRGRVLDLGLGC